MKKVILFSSLLFLIACNSNKVQLPEKQSVLDTLVKVNEYLMKKWPDPAATVTTNRERSSNLWTRATYYEGLMALYSVYPQDQFYQYAVDWGEGHNWQFRTDSDPHTPQIYTTNANHLCAAQTYIDLYEIDPQPERIKYVKLCIDSTLRTGKIEDWYWVDALQMAMPVYSRLARLYNNQDYLDLMHEAFMFTKEKLGGSGLYNPEDGLWWRDTDFLPPYTEPNGEDCYWSRGNGWAYAAIVRVMEDMPKDYKHFSTYKTLFLEMSEALLKVQRPDGYWNVSLHDPDNFGGKELTGTLFFVYGMMWGVNNNLLDSKYLNSAMKAWNAVIKESIRPDGSLAYIQGTGKEPKDGQPVTYDSKPDFEDYGVGIFLLAGTEIYKYLSE